ncbi:MAG: SET domain-containing protein [Gemmatimonadales bacterium]
MTPDEKVQVLPGLLGKGVHARFPMVQGERILEFDGPLLTHAEVLDLGESQAYTIQMGPDEYIDTRPPGRFTNHSCEPNAGIAGDRVLVALRDIEAGEEVQFDYSTTMSENHWTMICRCGRSRCRRLIRDFHFLPPSLQAYYIRMGFVQSFIVREWRNRAQLLDSEDRHRHLFLRQAGG